MKSFRIGVSALAIAASSLVFVPSALALGRDVRLSKLRAPVRQSIQREARGGKIQKVQKLSDDGNLFQAKIKKNGRRHEIFLNAQGKIIGRHLGK